MEIIDKYDENRQAWLFNDALRKVTFANSEEKIEALESEGWRITSELYATRWLMDNGYQYDDMNK